MSLTAGLEAVEKRKYFTPAGNRSPVRLSLIHGLVTEVSELSWLQASSLKYLILLLNSESLINVKL
jgi:hypothetical protein